jgi:hypothetical protein
LHEPGLQVQNTSSTLAELMARKMKESGEGGSFRNQYHSVCTVIALQMPPTAEKSILYASKNYCFFKNHLTLHSSSMDKG